MPFVPVWLTPFRRNDFSEAEDKGFETASYEREDQGQENDDSERFRAGAVVYVSGEENNSQVAARAARYVR